MFACEMENNNMTHNVPDGKEYWAKTLCSTKISMPQMHANEMDRNYSEFMSKHYVHFVIIYNIVLR